MIRGARARSDPMHRHAGGRRRTTGRRMRAVERVWRWKGESKRVDKIGVEWRRDGRWTVPIGKFHASRVSLSQCPSVHVPVSSVPKDMIGLLEKALKRIEALPEAEQDAIAAQILETIEDEEEWDRTLRADRERFRALADEALEEHRRGETRPIEDLLQE